MTKATVEQRPATRRAKAKPLWKRTCLRTKNVLKRAVANAVKYHVRPAVVKLGAFLFNAVDASANFLMAPFTAPHRLQQQLLRLEAKSARLDARLRELRQRDAQREAMFAGKLKEVEAALSAARMQATHVKAAIHVQEEEAKPQPKPPMRPAPARPDTGEYKTFHKMLQVGIPKEAVMQKVRLQGLDTPTFRAELGEGAPAPAPAPVTRPRTLNVPSEIIRPVPRPFTAKDLLAVKLKSADKPEEGGATRGLHRSQSFTTAKPGVPTLDALKGVQLRRVGSMRLPAKNKENTRVDFGDIVNIKLKKTDMPRSPGGTPKRPKVPRCPRRDHAGDFFKAALMTRFANAATTGSPTDDDMSDFL